MTDQALLAGLDVDGVTLRTWSPDDADVLAAAWSDDEIARWNPVPDDRGPDAAKRWIERVRARSSTDPRHELVIVDSAGTVLGEVGLRISESHSVAEVGFWIAEPARGRGHGRRLLTLASRLADALGLRGLIALTHADNVAALALLEAAGWLEVRSRDGRRAFVDRQI